MKIANSFYILKFVVGRDFHPLDIGLKFVVKFVKIVIIKIILTRNDNMKFAPFENSSFFLCPEVCRRYGFPSIGHMSENVLKFVKIVIIKIILARQDRMKLASLGNSSFFLCPEVCSSYGFHSVGYKFEVCYFKFVKIVIIKIILTF